MPSRGIKSLVNSLKEGELHTHREHRSKKGRKMRVSKSNMERINRYKQEKEKNKFDDLLNHD